MMPRPPRIHHPNTVYHVMSRGVEKRDIFRSDEDRRLFLCFLEKTLLAHDLSLFAYCLMGNHFHFLLAVSETPLAVGMQKLLTTYSLYFNRVHRRVGHVFQSRYKAIECKDMGYLIHLVAYIHLNPVRSGLSATPADWPWSSHGEMVGENTALLDLHRLTEVVGMTPAELRRHYLDRLAAGARPPRMCLTDLLKQASNIVGVPAEELKLGRLGREHARAKRMFAAWARDEGYSNSDIASTLNCSRAAVTQLMGR